MLTQEKIDQLSRIYNTLLLVSSKGEDTIKMGMALDSLKHFIYEEQQNLLTRENGGNIQNE